MVKQKNKTISNMKDDLKCPVCGKNFDNTSHIFFAKAPKTMLFRRDKNTQEMYGVRMVVCSEECKRKNEERYIVEKYKGQNIYCVNGRYMPYLDCNYYFNSIEEVKRRVDMMNVGIY